MKKSILLLGSLLVTSNVWAQDKEMGLDLSTDTAPIPPKGKPSPSPAAKQATAPAPKPASDDVGLDLSSTADVQSVLVAPPIFKVTKATQGAFKGFTAAKTTEKFDTAAHKRLVTAFQKELDSKALSAEVVMASINKEGVTPATFNSPSGLSKWAKASKAAWIIGFEFDKSGGLVGTIYNSEGINKGQHSIVPQASAITQKNADDMASLIAKQLIELNKPKPSETKTVAAAPTPLPPPVEEDIRDPELEKQATATDQRKDPKFVIAVGPGGASRTLEISGDSSDSLAELRNSPVTAIGIYAQFAPLQLIAKTAGKRWSDLELELNYRYAFVNAVGANGLDQGTVCSMTDDDLQIRGTYRFKVIDHAYGPLIGVGGGYSREQTVFKCNLPVLSTLYAGVDAQLRIKQPIYKNMVSLDLAFGPRFLFPGPDTTAPGFSFSGEAWLEARPISLLFARGGLRFSHLTLATSSLTAVDNRLFFAAEVGVFF